MESHEVDDVESGGDRLDELLDEPPQTDHHLGRFAGYRAGEKVRRNIALVLAGSVLCAVVAYRQYVRWVEYQRYHPFELSDEAKAEDRPREMHWSGGKARLGLSNEAPGIQVIHLPDGRIELAPGSERAQFKVQTIDGQTQVSVISGEIVQFDAEGHPMVSDPAK